MEKRKLPKFQTEAEEARWWYEHRDDLAKDFTNAVRDGRTGPGSMARLQENRRAEAAAAAEKPTLIVTKP